MGRKAPRRITEDYLHNAGLHYLQRFATGSENFRRVMIRKIDRSCRVHTEQDRETCLRMLDSLVEKFQRSGLLDDRTYIDGAVRSCRQKGLSERAIISRLQAKGIPAVTVTEAIAGIDGNMEGDGELLAAARYVRRRRLGAFAARERETAKDMASLARAGYGYETAQKILGMNREEIENLITGCCA